MHWNLRIVVEILNHLNYIIRTLVFYSGDSILSMLIQLCFGYCKIFIWIIFRKNIKVEWLSSWDMNQTIYYFIHGASTSINNGCLLQNFSYSGVFYHWNNSKNWNSFIPRGGWDAAGGLVILEQRKREGDSALKIAHYMCNPYT